MFVIVPLIWLGIPLAIACIIYVPYAAIKGRFVHPVRFALFGALVVWLLSGSWLALLLAASLMYSFALAGGKFWRPSVDPTPEE